MPATSNVGSLSARVSLQLRVRQDRERQVQPLDRLALIVGVLRRQPEQLRDAEPLQLGEMVAEAAGLRRAAARAGDGVPAVRQRLPGPAGARIDIDDRAAREPRQIDRRAVGRRQREVGQLGAGQMARRAVVLRHRKIVRQHHRIVRIVIASSCCICHNPLMESIHDRSCTVLQPYKMNFMLLRPRV